MNNKGHNTAITDIFESWQAEQFGAGIRSTEKLKAAAAAAMARNLTSRQRDALELYFLEGRKMNEIAELWGVSVSAVSRHISRGMKRLSEVIII